MSRGGSGRRPSWTAAWLRTATLTGLAGALAFLRPTPAGAQDSAAEDPAALHFQAGVERFRSQDYAGALDEFQASFDLRPVSMLRYNLGICHDQLRHLVQARNELGLYLAQTDPALVTPERRAEVETMLAELDRKLALVELPVAPLGADLLVDGTRVAGTPLAAPVPLLPGEHDLRILFGQEVLYEERIDARAGERRVIVVSIRETRVEVPVPLPVDILPPVAAPVPPPPSQDEALPQVWFWSAAGAAAALAVAGTVTGILVVTGESDFDDAVARCAAGADPQACRDGEDLGREVVDLGEATTVLFAVAGAAASAALALFFFTDFGESGAEEAARVSWRVGPVADSSGGLAPGLAVGATVRF